MKINKLSILPDNLPQSSIIPKKIHKENEKITNGKILIKISNTFDEKIFEIIS